MCKLNVLIVCFLAAVVVGPVTGCQVNPATGRTQLRLIPAAEVSKLGIEAKPQLIEEYGGEVPERQLREYVTEVGNRLARHVETEFQDVEWSFIVLDSDVINAFALPGGNVFISRGLLARFDNEAQLAGVLGHEIGHVTGQHVDERISQAVSAELGLSVLGAMTDSQLLLMGAQLATGGYQLRFGRGQEIEADELGMRYMTLAGYDPHGMLEVMQVLQAATAGGSQQPEFLSTHPHPETRISTITRLLNREYAYTQDNPEYRKHESRFQRRAASYLSHLRNAPWPTMAAGTMGCGCCIATP